MAYAFRNLFLPHQHNNHRAKLLHPQSIVVLLGLYLMGRSLLDISIGLLPGVLGYASQIDPVQVIELTNSERRALGLSPVRRNRLLDQAALAKATDMFTKGYWSHVSPTGVDPWVFISKAGYKYQHAGENLARDFSNPADIVHAWMASPTHRQNLLDQRYKDIGVAVMEGRLNGVETTIVVQMFGSAQTTVAQVASDKVEVKAALAVDSPPAIEQSNKFSYSGVSPLDLSRSWSLAFIILILTVLSLDWVFVLRFNLIRISGDTWAHLTYFIGILAISLIIRQGIVL